MKKITFFLFLLVSYTGIYGQQTDTPEVIPPSPQSQIFEKYLNHAINEYNGLPDISIPLYEIEINGLKIPIVLSYHASGVKYMQYDGEVGAGWSINAGGYRISRTIFGKSDLDYDMYSQSDYNGVLTSPTDAKWDKFLKGLVEYEYYSNNHGILTEKYCDSQYDHFTYSTPSTNGNFIVTNRGNNVHLIEQKKDVITINSSTARIIDDKGFRYDFGGTNKNGSVCLEKATYSAPNAQYTTTWPLKQITSPYNEQIKFDYITKSTYLKRENKYDLFIVADALSGEAPNESGIETESQINPDRSSSDNIRSKENMIFINEIETDYVNVKFNRRDGYDIKNSQSLISNIVITDKLTGNIRKINFVYKTTNSDVSSGKPWHILLTSVSIGNNLSVEKAYNFEYNEQFNTQNACADQWGYYTTYSTTSSYNLNLHNEFRDDNFVDRTFNPLGSTTITNLGSRFLNYFADRTSASSIVTAFSLKKITYPTGGYSEYIYESNRYTELGGNTTYIGGGLRIQKIKSYPGDGSQSITSVFKYGVNENGLGVPNFNLNPALFTDFVYNIRAEFTFDDLIYKFYSAVKTYSENPLGDASAAIFTVYYPEVAVYQYNDNQTDYNGKIVSTYKLPQQYKLESQLTRQIRVDIVYGRSVLGRYHGFQVPHNITYYALGYKPEILSRKYYNRENGLIQEEIYTYLKSGTTEFNGIKVKQRVTGLESATQNWNSPADNFNYIYYFVNGLYESIDYKIVSGIDLLSTKTTTLKTGKGNVVTIESYNYDSKHRLTKTIQTNSSGGNMTKEFVYPATGSPLATKNMVSTVVEEIISNNNIEVERIKTNYPTSTSVLPLPQSVEKSYSGASGYFTALTYNRYDSKGNLLQYTGRDGIPVSFIWGYKGKYPVVKVVGETYENITKTQIISPVELAYIQNGTYTGDALLNATNEIRFKYSNLIPQISTYTYKPLMGIETATDPNGIETKYEYDGFGRLVRILDHDNKVLQQFEYHYRNQ